jgi:hypothetical protein
MKLNYKQKSYWLAVNRRKESIRRNRVKKANENVTRIGVKVTTLETKGGKQFIESQLKEGFRKKTTIKNIAKLVLEW